MLQKHGYRVAGSCGLEEYRRKGYKLDPARKEDKK